MTAETAKYRPKQLAVSVPETAEGSVSPQAQHIFTLVSQELCQAEHISAALVEMPPLKMARPHLHQRHESIVFFIEGWVATLVGPELTPVLHGPGATLFIPEHLIHLGVNLSSEHRAVLLEIRSQARFDDDVVLMPELDDAATHVAAELQGEFAAAEVRHPPNWPTRGFGPYRFERGEPGPAMHPEMADGMLRLVR